MTTTPPTRRGAAAREYALSLLVWLLYALLGAGQSYLSYRLSGETPPAPWRMATTLAASYLVWAAVTPVILRLSRRTLREAGGLGRWLLPHLLLAASLAVATSAVYVGVGRLLGWPAKPGPVMHFLGMVLLNRTLSTLVLYASVVALGSALHHQRRLRERDVRAAQLEGQLSAARLAALRSQLHPHFLFNALNTVAMHLREAGSREGLDVVVNLSELLRRILRDEAQEATLARELELLDLYLAVERARFSDRLRVEVEVDALARSARVPVLILQPLVENAIRHGLSRRSASGRLRVAGAVREGRLWLSVEDDGPGLPAELRPGVGLSNTRARLEQLYPGEHRFELRDTGAGVQARIVLPFHPQEEPPEEVLREQHGTHSHAGR